MPELITFKCTKCQHVLKIGVDKAGRKAKCPRCATPLTVPGGAPEPPTQREIEKVEGYGLLDEPEFVAPKIDIAGPIRLDDDEEDDKPRAAKEGKGPKGQKRDKAVQQ